MAFRLESPAFENSRPIPRAYTGEGRDISPPLRWSDLPKGTRELALVCEDPDAPQDEPWVHWIAYKIAPENSELPEAMPPASEVISPFQFLQGKNSFDRVGYGGPMPPKRHGRHRYFFRLHALDTELPERPNTDVHALRSMIEGHVLAEAELMGTYERH